MPVPPSELTAEITIHDPGEKRDSPGVRSGMDAARASGLALDAGPGSTALSGSRTEVLAALNEVVEAAVDAGAMSISVVIEAPSQTR